MVSPARKAVNYRLKRIDNAIKDGYLKILERDELPKYVDSVMEEYDAKLSGAVTDRRSKTNPIYYRDEFQTALKNYDYITESSKGVNISLPDIDTFHWNTGRLRVIQNILEGIIGTYIEVSEEQYIGLFGRKPVIDPYDKTVPRQERVYLVRFDSQINRIWQEKSPEEAPVKYPFSNMASIDIFFDPNREFIENINAWLPAIISRKSKEMSK